MCLTFNCVKSVANSYAIYSCGLISEGHCLSHLKSKSAPCQGPLVCTGFIEAYKCEKPTIK